MEGCSRQHEAALELMMNELSLMWHIVLGLQGHVTVKEESHGTVVNAEWSGS